MNTKSNPKSTEEIALEFLKAHPTWYLFPVKAFEKSPPLLKDDLELASNDPDQIRAWGRQYLRCNWGVSLRKSKAIVMDVDTKATKVGRQTLADLTLEFGELPVTLTVQSPSGGLHYYFEGSLGIKQALGKKGFGADVDCPGYVLIPGCWLISGGVNGKSGNYKTITDAPVAPAPEWFAEFLKEKPAAAEAMSDEPAVDWDKPENIERMIRYLQEGAPASIQGKNGEKVLFDVACVLKDNGISEWKAVEILDQYYNVAGKCEPLWNNGNGPDADRLDIKVKNAYGYAKENVAGSATAEAQFGADPAEPLTPDESAAQERVKQQNEKVRPEPRPQRPIVRVSQSYLEQATRHVQRVLRAEAEGNRSIPDRIFKRDDELVRLNRNLVNNSKAHDGSYREDNALVIKPVSAKWAAARLDRSVQFQGASAGNPAKISADNDNNTKPAEPEQTKAQSS